MICGVEALHKDAMSVGSDDVVACCFNSCSAMHFLMANVSLHIRSSRSSSFSKNSVCSMHVSLVGSHQQLPQDMKKGADINSAMDRERNFMI